MISSKLIRQLNTNYVNKIINNLIEQRLHPLLNDIIANKNGEFLPRKVLYDITFDTIIEANFGDKTTIQSDEICHQLHTDLENVTSPNIFGRYMVLRMFGFLRPVLSSYFKPVYDIRERIHDNILYLIQKRREQNVINDDEKTWIDLVIEQIDTNQVPQNMIIADIYTMFLAGTDTTAISAEWGLILLANSQRFRKELGRKYLMFIMKMILIQVRLYMI